MILDKQVQMRVNSRTVKMYQAKGYKIPMRIGSKGRMVFDDTKYFTVNIEDVDKESTVLVRTACDVCGEEKVMAYREYMRQVDENGFRTCIKCKTIKFEKTNMEKYGVKNPTMLEDIQNKVKNTMNERYGVDWAMENKNVQEKRRNTFLEKYGFEWATQSDEIKEKTRISNFEKYGVASPMKIPEIKKNQKDAMLEKYGFENPMQVPEIRQKIEHTNIEKYGCKSPLGNIDVYEKAVKSKHQYGNIIASKQQFYIANLYCGEVNVPCSRYSLDIVVDNLDIEYDGKGHMLSVELKNISKEDFVIKEIIRDKIVKSNGYKIVRLISSTDKLPSDEILLYILDFSKNYLNNTNHSWIEWYFDENKYTNAENKDGIFFDFGTLHRLAESA